MKSTSCKKKKNVATWTHEVAPHQLTPFTLLSARLYLYFLNYSHWIMKGMKEISKSLTFALLGERLDTPVRYFCEWQKNGGAARRRVFFTYVYLLEWNYNARTLSVQHRLQLLF